MNHPARSPAPSLQPDVATAIVVDGTLIQGGLADPPVPWWSFTKTVLAATALVLAETGRLSLDEPLAGRSFTLRQLLQHRSGLSDYGWLRDYHDAVARGDEPWPLPELLRRASVLRTSEPGGDFSYSNIGYLYVRQSIEQAAGESIGGAVSHLVLAPLGIANARLVLTPDDLAGTLWGNSERYHPGWVYHGLLIGPPAAAALWLNRLLTGNLLSPATLRAMQEPRRLDATAGGEPDRPWKAPSYGLGLMIEASVDGPRFLGHSGGGASSASAVYHFPGRASAVTAAAFARTSKQALVEQRVINIARCLQG